MHNGEPVEIGVPRDHLAVRLLSLLQPSSSTVNWRVVNCEQINSLVSLMSDSSDSEWRSSVHFCATLLSIVLAYASQVVHQVVYFSFPPSGRLFCTSNNHYSLCPLYADPHRINELGRQKNLQTMNTCLIRNRFVPINMPSA
jgi:hypothetical protein